MFNKTNIKILTISFILSISQGQELGVGDTIPVELGLPLCANEPFGEFMTNNDSLMLHAYNGADNGSGSHYVIWLMLFTSWCPYCDDEAPFTQEIFESYQDSGLIVIGAGFDWGQPYNCGEWAEGYGLTYPLLDDEGANGGEGDENFFNLLASGGIPHNVIINHEMEIIYSQGGFNASGVQQALIEAFDYCGELCADPWDPECSEILGEIDNTFTEDNEPIIDIMDLVRLVDVISIESEIDDCTMITGDISDDGLVNMIDVYALASMLSQGEFDN